MTVRQKIAMAFGSALLTLLVGVVALVLVLRGRNATLAVEETAGLVARLDSTVAALVDAETGQRGYIITGDSGYLAPYHTGSERADSLRARVRALVAGDPAQEARFVRLDSIARAKEVELEHTIALRTDSGFAASAAAVRTHLGKRIMDDARAVAAEMRREARRTLVARQAARARARNAALGVIVIGSLLAFLLAVGINRSIRLDVIEAERTQDLLEQQAQELEEQASELEQTNEQLQETTAQAEEARDAAEVANRAKGEFLAVMSHELRTPLNAIVGYADLVHDGISGPVNATQQKHLDRIRLSARHLVELVDEILSFTRIDGGREAFHTGPIDLAEVTREAGVLVEPVATAKGLRFEIAPPPEGVTFTSDVGKVRQILVNLLSNAIKFTERGEVRLASRADDGKVVWEVTDTGIGISKAHLDRVFEPFWQADQTPTRRNGGAGLGLSVSRTLARALGGDVTVESIVGEGTRFAVWVPRQGHGA